MIDEEDETDHEIEAGAIEAIDEGLRAMTKRDRDDETAEAWIRRILDRPSDSDH